MTCTNFPAAGDICISFTSHSVARTWIQIFKWNFFFFFGACLHSQAGMLFPQDGFFSGITDMYFDVRFVRCVERHDRHDTLAASEFQPVGGHGCFSGSNT